MAVSPENGGAIAERLAIQYQDAELSMLATIVRQLEHGMDVPDWEKQQLGNAQQLAREWASELGKYNVQAAAKITKAVDAAYAVGAAGAVEDLSEFVDDLAPVASATRRAAVRGLAAEATNTLRKSAPQILRHVADVYKSVVGEAASLALNNVPIERAIQRGINKFLAQGITGFTDSKGRKYNLSDYTQMATRTATARAVLQGHDDTLVANGEDLVIIQPGPRACPICDKYAGLILSITGKTKGTVTLPSWADGKPVKVKVSGSVDWAKAGGWGHPNCRCGKKGYFAGVTKTPGRRVHDEKGYLAQQRQRALETTIRHWKVVEAIAIQPDQAARAKLKQKEWQAALRSHLAKNPDLKRQPSREQIGVGEVALAKADK